MGKKARRERKAKRSTEASLIEEGKKDSESSDTKGVAVEQYADVLKGAQAATVTAQQCIPFLETREISQAAVQRLKKVFQSRLVAGGIMASMVPLTGALFVHVIEHFRKQGLSEEESRTKASARNDWCGIVDGRYRFEVLRVLAEEDPGQFYGFSWTVLMLKPAPIEVLRGFARSQNFKQMDLNFVEVTIYDTLQGLRFEYKRLHAEMNGKQPTSEQIANAFMGKSGYADSTIRQLANTAVRLSDNVISAIGQVTNEDRPDLALAKTPKRTAGNEHTVVECRVFRKFLSTSSLKGSTLFMNGGKCEVDDQVRVNTIFRLKSVFEENGFRTVSPAIVTEQFVRARRANKESEKFSMFLAPDTWPASMENQKLNLLRSTKCDDDITSNVGNDMDVLSWLLKLYKSSCPLLVGQKMAKWKARNGASSMGTALTNNRLGSTAGEKRANAGADFQKQDVPQIFVSDSVGRSTCCLAGEKEQAANSVSRTGSEGERHTSIETGISEKARETIDIQNVSQISTDKSDEKMLAKEALNSSSTAPHKPSQSPGDILKEFNIFCHQTSWQDYDKAVEQSNDTRFDFILTDPPHAPTSIFARRDSCAALDMSNDEMNEFVKFVKRSLLPGAYIVLFTPVRLFKAWYDAFNHSGFSVMDDSLVFSKSVKGNQVHKSTTFPQSISEYALLATAPGVHPFRFKPNFDIPYSRFPSTCARNFNTLNNIPAVKQRLRRAKSNCWMRSNEMSHESIIEIMTTYCRNGGRVLDPFAGTMSTARACMDTGRPCVVIENDEECFSQAKARLELVAKAKADFRTDRTTRASAAIQKKAGPNRNEAASRSVAVGTFSADSDIAEDFHQTCARLESPESKASICIYSPSCAGKTKNLAGNEKERNTASELQNSETDCESQNSPKRSAPEAAENVAPTKAAKCAADSGRRQRSKRSNAGHATKIR